MDTTFAEAVSKTLELLTDAQREIGEVLLQGTRQSDLPVIEFNAG